MSGRQNHHARTTDNGKTLQEATQTSRARDDRTVERLRNDIQIRPVFEPERLDIVDNAAEQQQAKDAAR
jgi:hypothetical protein